MGKLTNEIRFINYLRNNPDRICDPVECADYLHTSIQKVRFLAVNCEGVVEIIYRNISKNRKTIAGYRLYESQK